MKFPVNGSSLFVVEGQLAFDNKAVYIRVGVSSEVVFPGPDLGGMKKGRNIGRIVKYPGSKYYIKVMLEENILFPG